MKLLVLQKFRNASDAAYDGNVGVRIPATILPRKQTLTGRQFRMVCDLFAVFGLIHDQSSLRRKVIWV